MIMSSFLMNSCVEPKFPPPNDDFPHGTFLSSLQPDDFYGRVPPQHYGYPPPEQAGRRYGEHAYLTQTGATYSCNGNGGGSGGGGRGGGIVASNQYLEPTVPVSGYTPVAIPQPPSPRHDAGNNKDTVAVSACSQQAPASGVAGTGGGNGRPMIFPWMKKVHHGKFPCRFYQRHCVCKQRVGARVAEMRSYAVVLAAKRP